MTPEEKATELTLKRPQKKNKAATVKKNKTDTSNTFKKIKTASGLFFLFLSVFLGIAFVSYLFSNKSDWAEVHNFSWALLDESLKAENIGGWFGAYFAHLFFIKGFGIASFCVLPVLFFTGLKVLIPQSSFHLGKIYSYTLSTTLFLSVLAGLITTEYFWSGAFGVFIALSAFKAIGIVGSWITYVFLLLGYAMIQFEWDLTQITQLSNKANTLLTSKNSSRENIPPIDSEVKDWEEEIIKENKTGIELLKNIKTADLSSEKNEAIEDENESNEFDSTFEIINKKTTEINSNPDELILDIQDPIEETEADDFQELFNLATPYDPSLDLSHYKSPPIELLNEYGSDTIKIDKDELERNKNQIVETLKNYSIEISKIKATIGPTVTLYEIVPAPGVRISKIKNLEDDIALALSALGIRIIAPIPGKGTIGIEVPNAHKEIVSMRSLIASEKFQSSKMDLPIALGKNIANEIFIADLAKMPHLLMAGATGQGKSVGINSILVSLLYKKHPAEIKFVMVDPKKVELSLFKLIEKHFLAKLPGEDDPIITDTKKVIYTLNALCVEMDNRYDLLKEAGVRNLKEYNIKFIARKLNPLKGHQFLPYIVLVVDEFADLMMTAGKEVETPIARLAQLARAVGIHLVIATQRPSVNIITGVIKANFPARIAFKVTSTVDSRTILDAGGANQLIGRGDMLFSNGGDMTRLQCGFVDTPEVEAIAKFIGTQQGYEQAFLLPEYEDEKGENMLGNFNDNEKDPLFDEAARIIVTSQIGSTSMLQRKLKLGYNRAGRLMDQLEQAGIVGANAGSKAREVLFKDINELQQYLSNR